MKRIFFDTYPTKAEAVEEGRKKVNGTGRNDKIFSPFKNYEVVKAPKGWKLYLIEKTTYEQIHGKPYRRTRK